MADPSPTITYLDGADVERLSADLPVVERAHETLLAYGRKEAGLTLEAALRWTTRSGAAARSLILPGWSGDSYGCKIINASLGNHLLGQPRAAGLIVLNDPETARPVCIMEGGRISALRTAGVSLAAVRAVRDLAAITRVAFLGCGRQAEVHRELLAAVCPGVEELFLFDQDAARARGLAARWAASGPGTRVTVSAGAREAVEQAQLTIAVTTTTEPYVELDWVPAGGTFVNVSLDDAAESLLLGCDHLFVDDWDLVVDDDHRLLGSLARSGRISGPGTRAPEGGRSVDAALPALFAGEYQRAVRPDERVVVNPFGMGVQDIALAAAVHERALAQGVGLQLKR
ncbi:ornithine cyclodeaminase [Streptomyces sp. MUM 178J]|uniref:ornithine cyclodeaminase n=1 Tax=Streptomyces sp. MUM 178J TaxID=2791991 RepID=UPI001F037236|nr:ornithine cyclodeaminase [Streptomyces sp. MUM 178J]WRQ80796.1 ornithine cyclodeaminase [Streptomyces sp. MUM 178J]